MVGQDEPWCRIRGSHLPIPPKSAAQALLTRSYAAAVNGARRADQYLLRGVAGGQSTQLRHQALDTYSLMPGNRCGQTLTAG